MISECFSFLIYIKLSIILWKGFSSFSFSRANSINFTTRASVIFANWARGIRSFANWKRSPSWSCWERVKWNLSELYGVVNLVNRVDLGVVVHVRLFYLLLACFWAYSVCLHSHGDNRRELINWVLQKLSTLIGQLATAHICDWLTKVKFYEHGNSVAVYFERFFSKFLFLFTT